MQEEVETEDVRETDRIFVGTGEVSEEEEDHIGVFHLAKNFRASRLSGSDMSTLCTTKTFGLNYLFIFTYKFITLLCFETVSQKSWILKALSQQKSRLDFLAFITI